jgi:hypothetical protein
MVCASGFLLCVGVPLVEALLPGEAIDGEIMTVGVFCHEIASKGQVDWLGDQFNALLLPLLPGGVYIIRLKAQLHTAGLRFILGAALIANLGYGCGSRRYSMRSGGLPSWSRMASMLIESLRSANCQAP